MKIQMVAGIKGAKFGESDRQEVQLGRSGTQGQGGAGILFQIPQQQSKDCFCYVLEMGLGGLLDGAQRGGRVDLGSKRQELRLPSR